MTPQGDWVDGWPGLRSLLLDDLDDILMFHGVSQAHPLRAVLGAGALGREQGRGATSVLTKAKADGAISGERWGCVECQSLNGGPSISKPHRPQTAGLPSGLTISGSQRWRSLCPVWDNMHTLWSETHRHSGLHTGQGHHAEQCKPLGPA